MSAASILQRWVRSVAGTPAEPPPSIRTASRTHVGRVRTVNEDRLLDRPDRGLWGVADGMGGHSAGAAAATTAIAALDGLADGAGAISRQSILASLARANAAIHASTGIAAGTSGATIVVVAIDGAKATICWAGDSRAYRIRAGIAERLTHDHSLVQELVDAGMLAPAAAERHPRANVVTRALGVAPTIDVAVTTAVVLPGDRLLLCSDGVSRSLDDRDFTTMPRSIDAFADRLLANALQRDGTDNATLVLVDVAAP